MADNLIFHIEFDLQKAVEKAGQDWDKTYAKKLETHLAKRPIKVKLDFENLNDVKTRLAQLKIEPITPETRASIKELARELQVLAKALEQVQKYSKNPAQLGQQNFRNDVQLEKLRQANERLEIQKRRVALAEQKHAEAMKRSASASKQLSSEFQSQDGYVSRLIKRMAVYASFSYMGQFLTNVREVTAQFELQRVSLGAIIQDQNRANQLFSEIKSFALKSPVSILDLTKYTKQLAAYKIGVDELFETTKKLTDVSVGLGVSMDRVVLAYGQTRATGYLRASEIRQFTEMGVPIVEELAAKLSKMNGELVTAAQVMDMVSKRGISFELVKEVFDDMTSAGGMFYNMQEKQGNTLFGLWAKLGDAASVMYDQIGNTESVNSGMKTAIGLLTEFMRNWKALANTAAFVVAPSALFGMFTKYALSSTRKQAADAAATAATKAREAAVLQLNRAIEKGYVDDINAAYATLQKAKADEVAAQKAATKTGLLASGFKSIASSMAMGLGIGLVVTAVTTLAYKLFEAWENARRLKNKLDEIDAERVVVTEQSVRNFEYLADAAIKAADGSKEQKDKLEELHRTFQGMIPVENMSIENLQRLRSGADSAAEGYKSLTESIRNYIAQQQKQKALGAIEEEFGAKRINAMKSLYDWFDKQGLGVEERTRFFAEFEKQAQDTSKTLKEQIVSAFNEAGIEGGEKLANSIAKEKGFWNKTLDWLGKTQSLMFGTTAVAYNAAFPDDGYINDLADATRRYNEEVAGTLSYYEELEGNIGKYTKALEEAKQHMADYIPVGFKENTFAYQQQVNAEQIRTWGKVIVDALKAENVKIENEWFNIDKDKAFDITDIASISIKAIKDALGTGYGDIKKLLDKIAESYNEIIPKDAVVRSVRSKFEELANSMGLIDKVKGNLMGATEGLEDYRKKINDTAKDYAQQVENLTKVLAATPVISLDYKDIADKLKNTKDLEEFYSKMAEILGKSTSGGGRTSDPRLQNLKEEISLVQKLYNEYKQLEKQEVATKAAADMRRMAGDTLDMFKSKYNIDLPTDAKDLTAALEILYKKMAALPKKVFPSLDKDLKELRWTIEKVDIDESQKNIEAELKRLADRISRTKTAKEFYEKILEQTGDINIATRVSMSIYGSTGEELFNDTVEQIREAFKTGSEEHPIDLDISAAIDLENQRIDYKKLADIYDKYQDEIIEKRRDTAKKIATEGQKEVATDILNWRKSLAKAKSYEQKRTDIINTATAERAKIIRETTDPKERGELLGLSYSKQAQELAKLAVDEFKSSDDYIKVFQDLDRVSTQTLDRMKKRLEEMIATVKDTENVEGLKTLVEQLDKIKEERETRNPIEGIIDSFKEYAKARKDYRTAEAEEAAAKAEFAQQEVGLNQAIQTAKAEQATAQQRVNDLKAQGKENTSDGVAAELALNEATKKVTQAEENRNKAVKKVNNAEQKTTDALDAQKAALAKLQKNVNAMANAFNSAASSIKTIADMMGIAEDSELGDIVNGLVDGLNNAATIMTTILAIAIAIEAACWWLLAIGAAVAAFSAIGSWLTGSKVRKANKEIERQQKLLDQLEYTYGRLEKAADKVFGRDYLNNYNQQLKNLQAQQEAYLKQAEAERSKGKKKDKDKIKEYEDAARETADKIKELQDDLAAHFTGSSRTDAARQMAKSWIDAKASMSDTFAAIKGDYADMVKNMLVEGAAARVIENALSPVWDSMEKMLAKNDVQGAIDSLVNGMDSALNAANNGMEVLWKALEARGYDMKKLIGDTDSEYTGIAKNIAGATSEEINTAAAIGNTLLYYAAPIPRIDENLARVVAIMEGRAAALPTASGATVGAIDYTEMFTTANQHLSSLPRMEQHLAEIHTMLGRALKTKGSTTGFNTFLNS